jgi:hypothetical protein
MRFLPLLLVLLSFEQTLASPFLGLGYANRLKETTEGVTLDIQATHSFLAGWSWPDWNVSVEMVGSRHESKSGNILVVSVEQDILFWARRMMSQEFWRPYFGLAGGQRLRSVETHLIGTVATSRGRPDNLMGLALGAESQSKDRLNFGYDVRYVGGVAAGAFSYWELSSRLLYQF